MGFREGRGGSRGTWDGIPIPTPSLHVHNREAVRGGSWVGVGIVPLIQTAARHTRAPMWRAPLNRGMPQALGARSHHEERTSHRRSS
jgi:hypothetical protein